MVEAAVLTSCPHYLQREIRGSFYDMDFKLQKRGILLSPKQTGSIYDDMFFSYNRYNSVLSAVHVLRILMSAISVKSMVDFGCGTGSWLYAAKRFGVLDILGLDGEYIGQHRTITPVWEGEKRK